MDLSPVARSRPAWSSLALLGVSLAVLGAGGFVQFDDTSGFGSERWNLPLGLVAVVLALSSVRVGVSDRTAGRALGSALAIVDGALILLVTTNDGFRFIWSSGESELLMLQIGLGFAALFLLAPNLWSPEDATDEASYPAVRGPSAWERTVVYVSALALAMLVAFFVGMTHFEITQCGGPDADGECDVAGLEGLLWAGGALVLGMVAIVVAEVARAWSRRGARRSTRGVRP